MKIFDTPLRHLPENAVAPKRVKWSHWNDCFWIDDSRMACFNTMTGALALLDREEWRLLKGSSAAAEETLVKLGFLVDEGKDEKAKWEKMYIEGKHDESDLDLTILPTMQCQFRCVYCFEGEKSNRYMPQDVQDEVKRFVASKAERLSHLNVMWFGGEPLLAYPVIRTLSQWMVNFCQIHGVRYTSNMTTNGFSLDERRCRELVHDCCVTRFTVTVDGTRPIHDSRRPLVSGRGTFDAVWRNIGFLADAGATVIFRVTIDKGNVADIPRLIDLVANSGFAKDVHLVFVRTIEILNTPDRLASLVYTPEEFAPIELELLDYAHSLGLKDWWLPSSAPLGGCLRRGDIVIGTHGETFKCLDCVGEKKWVTGSIRERIIDKQPAWYQDYLQWTPGRASTCRACKLQPLCSGGCPHNALFAEKKHGTDILCPDWKPNYRNVIVRYIKERLRHELFQTVLLTE